MSNWHIRAGDENANAFGVIYHIPIPNENNLAGVPLKTALVGSGLGGASQMQQGPGPGQITEAENGLLKNGSLLEVFETVYTNPQESITEFEAKIVARFDELSNPEGESIANLKRRLQYWGLLD